jgi:hypothetical protein
MVATADLVRNVTSVVMYRNGEVLWREELADILVYGEGLPWTMGQDYDNRDGVVASDFFDGTLDEYRFWSRPLSQGEVQYSMAHAIDHGPEFPHLSKFPRLNSFGCNVYYRRCILFCSRRQETLSNLRFPYFFHEHFSQGVWFRQH